MAYDFDENGTLVLVSPGSARDLKHRLPLAELMEIPGFTNWLIGEMRHSSGDIPQPVGNRDFDRLRALCVRTRGTIGGWPGGRASRILKYLRKTGLLDRPSIRRGFLAAINAFDRQFIAWRSASRSGAVR